MPKPGAEDPRLIRVTAICLALAGVERKTMGKHASFLAGKKTFAYFLNDHHGDKIVSVCCKALPGDHLVLAKASPEKFYLPAYIGPRGWVGLRLDTGKIDWDEVTELVRDSYRRTAPKRLAALLK